MAPGNPAPRCRYRPDVTLTILFEGMASRRHMTNLLAVLFVLLVLCLLPTSAHAGCIAFPGASITFSPPSTITLPSNLQVGSQTVLWTSPAVAPSSSPVLICVGTDQSGLYDYVNASGTPIGNNLFPTGITNLYFQIQYNGTPLPIIPPGYALSSSSSVNQSSVLTLVATGPITNGSTLNGGQIAQWQVGSSLPSVFILQSYVISTVTFKAPACSVAVDPTVVTLPTVNASAFSGTGSTTGLTPFNVQLTCSSGASLSVTLATTNQQTGATGVIAPTTGNGYAGNVGVQVLQANGTTPVTFGTAISEGATPNGTMDLPFYARYYQTGSGVTAGTVTATATYTLTYQ